jgi:hypothetical protein
MGDIKQACSGNEHEQQKHDYPAFMLYISCQQDIPEGSKCQNQGDRHGDHGPFAVFSVLTKACHLII